MTPLSLATPLRSLLDLARAEGRVSSQADFGARRKPPVRQGPVGDALAAGAEIRLSTLAAYARAAGYALVVGCGGPRARCWNVAEDGRASGVGVGDLRDALAGLGLEMTLTVEELT